MNDKRVLIYGFGPYGKYHHNVTMQVIDQINQNKLAQTVIFRTHFSRKMFVNAFRQFPVEIIIGLGQDSRARKIRIERRAINWRKPLNSTGSLISRQGPKFRYVSLKLRHNADATVTYDAGDYVCNYSMYVMSELCKTNATKYAFLHLPIKLDIKKTVAFIRQKLGDELG